MSGGRALPPVGTGEGSRPGDFARFVDDDTHRLHSRAAAAEQLIPCNAASAEALIVQGLMHEASIDDLRTSADPKSRLRPEP
jgi:hypothetical protein